MEQGAEEILEGAREKEVIILLLKQVWLTISYQVAFLVVGDPFGATTHSDLVLRAKELGIPHQVCKMFLRRVSFKISHHCKGCTQCFHHECCWLLRFAALQLRRNGWLVLANFLLTLLIRSRYHFGRRPGSRIVFMTRSVKISQEGSTPFVFWT